MGKILIIIGTVLILLGMALFIYDRIRPQKYATPVRTDAKTAPQGFSAGENGEDHQTVLLEENDGQKTMLLEDDSRAMPADDRVTMLLKDEHETMLLQDHTAVLPDKAEK